MSSAEIQVVFFFGLLELILLGALICMKTLFEDCLILDLKNIFIVLSLLIYVLGLLIIWESVLARKELKLKSKSIL